MKTSHVLDFEDVMIDVTKHFKKIDTNQYCTTGSTPIVDQSANYFCGYTDIQPDISSISPPYIIFGDHTRRFKFVEKDFVLGADGTKVLKTKIDADHKYLFHFFKSIKLEEAGYSRHYKFLKRTKVFVPPLAEQQRIAALLDIADNIIKKRQLAIAKFEQLAQGVFVEMFGGNKFPFKSLKQLGKVKTGGTPPSSKEGMFGSLIPFITPGDLESKSIPKRFLTLEGAKESVIVKEGSALVCCIGATIGKMSKAKTQSAFNQQLNAVEWGDEINPNFGIHALRQIKSKIINGGSATTLPIIKKSLFEKLEIIVPPLELQEKFSQRIKKIEALIDICDDQLAKSKSLMLSLQHQSFGKN
jgi:type I restriction enzyme S subunit